jgi:hypothetical protein
MPSSTVASSLFFRDGGQDLSEVTFAHWIEGSASAEPVRFYDEVGGIAA